MREEIIMKKLFSYLFILMFGWTIYVADYKMPYGKWDSYKGYRIIKVEKVRILDGGFIMFGTELDGILHMVYIPNCKIIYMVDDFKNR